MAAIIGLVANTGSLAMLEPFIGKQMQIQRIAAFSQGPIGGNPAGVVLCEALPAAEQMQSIAAEVGYSETAFATPMNKRVGKDWRVRYFAPVMEVPFCGHATIALGVALALAQGDGVFALHLNQTQITVEGRGQPNLSALLQSPGTQSTAADQELVSNVLALFNYSENNLDPRLPPAIAEAGARHLVLALASRELLSAMHYDLEAGRSLMSTAGLGTISFIFAEAPRFFHARNVRFGRCLRGSCNRCSFSRPSGLSAGPRLAAWRSDRHYPGRRHGHAVSYQSRNNP
jgi:PhzF family phenazine biosynthesis protein